MAEIVPFTGLLYNTSKTGSLESVTAPPYDVIPQGEVEKYYSRSAHNIIRLILGRQFPGDDETDNRYLRSAHTFKQWINEGVLTPDSADAVYIYRQEYYVEETKKTLTGIVCALRIQDSGTPGAVMPHEETLGKPKADRLNLLRESQANFSPIFGIFEDRGKKLIPDAEKSAEGNPLIDIKDECDIRHTVLRLTDPAAIRKLQACLKKKNILIADGHHRYEAARLYRDEAARLNRDHSGEERYNYILAYIANMLDEGLTILPAHRLVNISRPATEGFSMEKAGDFFSVEETRGYEEISEKMAVCLNSGRHAFGMYHGGKYYFLELKEDSGYGRHMNENFPRIYQKLDVCIAHGILIDKIINGGERMRQENLEYEKDPQKAVAMVDEGKFTLAIFLNPTKIEQVLEVASSGLRMPGKATYFYPKPLGGLLLRKL